MWCCRKCVLTGMMAAWGLALFAEAAQASSAISVFPDRSCLWQIINFLVLIWALNLILYRPIRNIVAKRQEHMTGLDNSIAQFNQEARDKESAFADGIKDARADGMKIKTSLLEEGVSEEKRIIEAINQKAQQALVDNKAKIAQDIKKAAADLQKEIDMFAAEIGRKILGRELS